MTTINWPVLASELASEAMLGLAVVSALPYTLGDLGSVIPPEWKAKVFLVSASATGVLRIVNAVARAVRAATLAGNVPLTPIQTATLNTLATPPPQASDGSAVIPRR